MGVLKMEWRIGEKMCGWVGLHHFLLMMILWQHGDLNYCCKKRMKLWNIMEISWFFWLSLFLYYYSSFSFDDDVAKYFKEGVRGKKNNIFCCLNFRHHITNFCSHYYCCTTFELLLLLL